MRPNQARAVLAVTTGVVIAAMVAGCGLSGSTTTAPAGGDGASGLPVGDSNAPMPTAGTCTIRHEGGQTLPDPRCTPGAVNPDVTQGNIASTICHSGWTSTVRPGTSITGRWKRESDVTYGLSTDTLGEYDHLVSIELGGAPLDPRNLWVEPGTIPNPKDAIENKLNQAVCSGLVPLAIAQQAIAHDWITAVGDVGLATVNGKLCMAAEPTRCATSRGSSTSDN